MKRLIRVGSRESALAISQTNWVIDEIRSKYPDIEFEVVKVKTKGDIILDTRLDKIGGKGLFIKELEQALLDGTVDFAVHSMKDMPAEIPEGLVIAALSKREDPRDVLVTSQCTGLGGLKKGAVIGTSSIRREVQLLERRPDLTVKTLRGNVLTRLEKLLNSEYDALVLAAAGLKRLGLEEKCAAYLEIREMIPAVGQGVLCIEARKDEELLKILQCVHDSEAALCISAERAFMVKLNGGCSTPIAAHAVIEEEKMKVYGMFVPEGGRKIIRAEIEGSKNEAAELGERLADILLKK